MILIACRGALFGSAYSYVGAEKQIRRQPRKSNWAGAIGKGKRGWRAEELAESRYQAAANRGNQLQRRRHAAPSPSIGANKVLQPTAYRAASFGGWFRVRCARRGRRRLSTTLYANTKIMKITGYKRKDTDMKGLMEMETIAIAASPESLREVAKFLNHAAEEMEEMGTDYDHIHLMDAWEGWSDGFPDIQVVSEKYI